MKDDLAIFVCAATLQDIVNHDSPKHPIPCGSQNFIFFSKLLAHVPQSIHTNSSVRWGVVIPCRLIMPFQVQIFETFLPDSSPTDFSCIFLILFICVHFFAILFQTSSWVAHPVHGIFSSLLQKHISVVTNFYTYRYQNSLCKWKLNIACINQE